MRNLLVFFLSFLVSEVALGAGWWCYAQSHDGQRVLKWGDTLEHAKNNARVQCNMQTSGNCQVTQCYEDTPYKFACVAARYQNETTVGGFRAYSNSEPAARQVVTRNCTIRWGAGKCVTACYPNFIPPREDATSEDLHDAASFIQE